MSDQGRFKPGDLVHNLYDHAVWGEVVKRTKTGYTIWRADTGRVRIDEMEAGRGLPKAHKTLKSLLEVLPEHLEEQVLACNCARCNKELLGLNNHPAMLKLLNDREVVADRLNGRPYCLQCLTVAISESMNNQKQRK